MNLLDNQSKAEEIDRMYMDLEDRLLQSIIEHLKDYEQPIDSDTWLMQKLAEIGKLNAQNIKLIKEQSGMTQEAINHMLLGAAEEAIDAIDPGLRKLAKKNLVEDGVEASKSKNISQVMETILGQSKDILNKTNTVMSYMAKDAYTKLVFDINLKAKEIANKLSFLKELGDEATAATIGIKSRQEAMISCIKKFSERGIPAFIDKAGREWTPEAYVNMNIRNTIKNTAEEVQTARCKDFGVNLISIDSHSGARPKCAKDQGKIFDLNNGSGEVEDARGRKVKYYPWNSSSYGEPDGILGINCRHHKHPFIPGVNIHRYFSTEDMDENNKLYKQTQKQRQLEREVRKQKRECVLMKGLVNAEEMDKAATKLKHKQNRLEAYIENHKELHRRKDRERVVGYDKDISAKVNGINRRKTKHKVTKGEASHLSKARKIRSVEDLNKVSKSSIIKLKKYEDIQEYFKSNYGIQVTGFEDKDLFAIKATMAGIDDALRMFPEASEFITQIVFDSSFSDYARISADKIFKISKRGLQYYGTGVHEVVHALDFVKSGITTHRPKDEEFTFSKLVYDEALKNLKIRKNAKNINKLLYAFTGSLIDNNKPFEVLAYAVETEMGGGPSNDISKELYRVLLEKISKKEVRE